MRRKRKNKEKGEGCVRNGKRGKRKNEEKVA